MLSVVTDNKLLQLSDFVTWETCKNPSLVPELAMSVCVKASVHPLPFFNLSIVFILFKLSYMAALKIYEVLKYDNVYLSVILIAFWM